MEPQTPVNHIFIDFENVHKFDLSVIGARTVSLTLLLGAKHTKLDAALVEKLLEHAASVQLVRMHSSGRDALDFTLVYYLGRAVAADPAGCFHIISKDQGFDPLVEHLKSLHIRVNRHEDLSTLLIPGMPRMASSPGPPPSKPITPAELRASPKPEPMATPKAKMASKPKPENSSRELRKMAALDLLIKANRPKTHSKLRSHFKAHFGKWVNDLEISELIDDLKREGHLVIEETGAITCGTALT